MKSRQQLQREIAERAAALTAQQQQWQQQRVEQRQQRRAALASPKLLAGSFATGIALGLLSGRRKKRAGTANTESQAPSLLSRTARELLPIVQPLLLTAATQWWQQRQRHEPSDQAANEPPADR